MEDLLRRIEDYVSKSDATLHQYTTYNHAGRQSRKIVIEYDIKERTNG